MWHAAHVIIPLHMYECPSDIKTKSIVGLAPRPLPSEECMCPGNEARVS